MNSYVKIFIGLISAALILGYFSFDTSTEEPANPEQALVKVNNSSDAIKKQATLTQIAEIETKIDELERKAHDKYAKILSITGPNSGKNTMRYEDNWCEPSQDLTEQDQLYAKTKMAEWKLSQGSFVESNSDNAEYFKPYEEEDLETLFRLAKNDDGLALITLSRHPDVKLETQRKAAKRLLILGYTKAGLNTLISSNLALSDMVKESDPDKSFGLLKQAFAYAEFGLMRNNLSSIAGLLLKAADAQKGKSDTDILQLTEKDFKEIGEMAKSLYNNLSANRVNLGLPKFEDIDDTKEANVYNAQRLFWYHVSLPTIIDSAIFPPRWHNIYIKKSPCFKRKWARHNFMLADEPAIKKEIAELKEQLN